jgi:hypothetical protein
MDGKYDLIKKKIPPGFCLPMITDRQTDGQTGCIDTSSIVTSTDGLPLILQISMYFVE